MPTPYQNPQAIKRLCSAVPPPPPTDCVSHRLLLLGQGPLAASHRLLLPPILPPTTSSSPVAAASAHHRLPSVKAPWPPPTASSSHGLFLPPPLQVWPQLALRTIGRPRSRALGRLLLPPAASPTASSSSIKALGCRAPPAPPPTASPGVATTSSYSHRHLLPLPASPFSSSHGLLPRSPPPTASSSHHLFRYSCRCLSAPSAASPTASSSSVKALGFRAPPAPPPTASRRCHH